MQSKKQVVGEKNWTRLSSQTRGINQLNLYQSELELWCVTIEISCSSKALSVIEHCEHITTDLVAKTACPDQKYRSENDEPKKIEASCFAHNAECGRRSDRGTSPT